MKRRVSSPLFREKPIGMKKILNSCLPVEMSYIVQISDVTYSCMICKKKVLAGDSFHCKLEIESRGNHGNKNHLLRADNIVL